MKLYLLLYLLFFCVSAYADTVKWIDAHGNVSYSDTLPNPDFIVNTCQFPLSTMDEQKDRGTRIPPPPFDFDETASRIDPVVPISMLLGNNTPIDFANLKTTLLQDATHGKIFAINYGSGIGSYWYFSEPKYKGRDRAVFLAKLNGKFYKIVIDLLVFHTAAEAESVAVKGLQPSWCNIKPKLAKVK